MPFDAVFSEVQGLTPKNPAFTVRFVENELAGTVMQKEKRYSFRAIG